MAARDDFYRNQKTLDIIFSLSCLAMLASLIWMFMVDYDREYKSWQRKGREVEVALLQEDIAQQQRQTAAAVQEAKQKVRAKLDALQPGISEQLRDETFVDDAKRLVAVVANDQIRAWMTERDALKPGFQRASDLLSARKAERDSLVSERDILKHQGQPKAAAALEFRIEQFKQDYLDPLEQQVAVDKETLANLERNIADARKEASDAVADLGRLVMEQQRLQRTADSRKWGPGAAFRNLPIIDAFAPPFKVRQDIPEGLTIDYTFKQVQRVDRCASCHMFIDKADFSKDRLAALKDLLKKLKSAEEFTAEEQALWDSFPERLRQQGDLSDAEIATFCGHPRQHLFVGSNSPHPVEKFGCTICHAGQGGSATFNFAYHFPDAGKTGGKTVESYRDKHERWSHDYKWLADLHPNYLWDMPQIPARFIESSCVKCHHQILDLVRTDGREEAPKLIQGYRLVRDLGCFGCHEIAGWKGGRSVGPDLRLEPYPPLDELTPEERSKALADPTDPPGNMRKNGPGLRRLAEKSQEDWINRWIRSPRGFRPETRMPHYYGLHNNHPTQTSDYQRGNSQLAEAHKGYPDAEIRAMTFYLQKASESYLRDLKNVHGMPSSQWNQVEETKAAFRKVAQARVDNPALTPRTNDPGLPPDMPASELAKVAPNLRDRLTKDQLRAVLDYFRDLERLRGAATALETRPWPAPELEGYKGDPKKGEELFQLKGCLACHGHEQIRGSYKDDAKMADLLGEAHFGPPLVGLREKLNAEKNPAQAEKWLYGWLTNPNDYHSRTFMPNPQLNPKERADLVAWLLGPGDVKPPAEWANVKVPEDKAARDAMVRYYLEKALATKAEAAEALTKGIKDVRFMRPDADERLLAINQPADSPVAAMSHEDRKLFYLGRKTIGRNGCFACHDIPGFETAKPIGVPLNDWGMKDADRLAFENINEYLETFYSEDAWNYDLCKEWEIYDPFFHDALEAKRRDGYLHQKLFEPRTYDWGRFKERSWDDHIKMPQFQFARTVRRPGESDKDFAKRSEKEEREAREAVMTFILGLTAENVPPKFVHRPNEDRAKEIAGLKTIEKYNCNGCHVFKPGSYEVALNEDMRKELQRNLTNPLTQTDLKNDPGFPESTAWRNPHQPPSDRVTIRGLPRAVNQEDGLLSMEVWDATAWRNEKGEVQQLPAGQSALNIPLKSDLPRHDAYGGLYTDIHSRVLARLERKNLVGDRPELMGSSPPPLMREGQKVQPRWLLEFLQRPFGMRPSVYRHLKMPQFNLSEEEAQTLVNYFIAVDRQEEKGLGLEYFMPRPKQWSPEFHERKRAEYRAKLKQLTDLSEQEIAQADYFEAGWQILVNRQLCLQCHNAGTFVAEGELVAKAPAFYHAPERLRPDYIHRWVSVPKRVIPYTKMNWFEQFYHRDDYAALQKALTTKPVRAAIQLAPVWSSLSTLPVGGLPMPVPDGMFRRLQQEMVLSPNEKVEAARDAIQSWGFLKQPPPTGVKAGPRPDALIGEQP